MDEQKILDLLIRLVEDVADVKAKVDRLSIENENIIIPRLDILYEGQTDLITQVKKRALGETVKELESTVHTITDATQKINQEMKTIKSDITELKKAL